MGDLSKVVFAEGLQCGLQYTSVVTSEVSARKQKSI